MAWLDSSCKYNLNDPIKATFFYGIPIFIIKESCQNILKKKKENTETTDSAKTTLLFFRLSVGSICLGI